MIMLEKNLLSKLNTYYHNKCYLAKNYIFNIFPRNTNTLIIMVLKCCSLMLS